MPKDSSDPEFLPAPLWAPGMLAPRVLPGASRGPAWTYTPELGQAIADGVASGVSIHHQRAESPDTVPPATVVRAWVSQFPAFGIAMAHAERVRADLLMEQALMVADEAKGQPARVAIMVGQRVAMAERLDRGRWGRTPDPAATGLALRGDMQPVAPALSDDDLASLAVAGAAERVPMGGGGDPGVQ